MRKIFMGLALAATAFASSTHADVVNIDIGRSAGTTTTTGFNNITEMTSPIVLNSTTGNTPPPADIISLVDDAGVGTSLTATLTVDNIPNDVLAISTGNFATAANYATVASNFSGTIPQSAFEDGVFLRDENNNEFITVTIAGLLANEVADLRIFGSRNTNGLVTNYTATGATSTSGTITPNPGDAGYSPYLEFTGLAADANGEISLTVNAPGTNQSGAFNFLQIETFAVPEPSSFVLLSLSGFVFAGRRRRN